MGLQRKGPVFGRDRQEPVYPVTMTGPDSFTLDGQTYTGKPQVAGRAFAEGERAYVGFARTSRRQPIILAAETRRVYHRNAPWSGLQLALWPDCTGSPYCNRGPLDNCDAPQWDGAATTIDTLPRYYYDDALQSTVDDGETAPTLANLLSWEGVTLLDSHPSTSLPRAAVTVSLYDGTGGSLVGQLLREYQLEEGIWTQTGEWIHIAADPVGSLPTNNAQRRQGYLFYDKSSDTYTIAAQDGLLLATRGNEPTPALCAWETAYGALPGNSSISVAGGYAITGAWQADGAIDLYYRHSGGYWLHMIQVDIAAQLTDCDYVEACGIWDPYDAGDTETCENSRWAYMGGEWYLWITGTAGSRTPEGSARPTLAQSKLIAIRAATGAVRVVETLAAPLELLEGRSGLEDALVAKWTYQSTHHPADWTATGNPSAPWADDGNSDGYSTGQIIPPATLGTLIVTEVIPPADVPASAGGPDPGDYRVVGQEVDVYTGWTTDRDPTIASKSVRTECAESADIPRGVVDSAESRFYVATRQSAWLASDSGSLGASGSHPYVGYVDFAAGVLYEDFPLRLFSFSRDVEGSFSYTSAFDRLVIRKYSSNAILDTLDLTREFSVTEDDFTRYYRQKPTVHEMGVAGDYLWILASDWWAYNSQKLSMIVVAKSTLTEVDRIDLSPDTGRLWLAEYGRPQLVVGVDGSGPWAEVLAWWSGDFDEWFAQELRVVADELTVTVRAQEASATNYPDKFRESINLAISPLKQFFLDDAVDFKVREE